MHTRSADAAQAVQQDMASTSAPQQAAPAADSVPGTDRAASTSASSSGSSSNRTSNLSNHANASPRLEAQLTLEQYKEIYDRLIKIFQVWSALHAKMPMTFESASSSEHVRDVAQGDAHEKHGMQHPLMHRDR